MRRRPYFVTSGVLFGLMLAATQSNVARCEQYRDRVIASNMTVRYLHLPGEVDEPAAMFSDGEFYGRLRSNTFLWDWDEPVEGSRENHEIGGIGGSLIFKSGVYGGLGFTVGAYATSNPYLQIDEDDFRYLRAGKDLVARGTRDDAYVVLGEAFLEWEGRGLSVRAGRQLYESAFTASNDTKMIPNTFDGLTVGLEGPWGLDLRAAWFGEQKLRDHTSGHDVITFRDREGRSWRNQDDAGVHRGLSYGNFLSNGVSPENDLWIGSISRGFGSLDAALSGSLVPDIFRQAVLEVGMVLGAGGWTMHPAVKLMRQFDTGGGDIGGASLLGTVDAESPGGYDDPGSLDGGMIAARLEWRHAPSGFAFRVGYSDIANDADIVAPWRGFPTGGYTRPMGQYNWRANTQTWTLQLRANLSPYLPWAGTRVLLRHARMDMDETKAMTDRTAFHIDIDQSITSRLSARLRSLFVDGDGPDGYDEYRLEFNYLF